MKVTWGSAGGTEIAGEDIGYGIRPPAGGKWVVVTEFSTDTFGGMVLEDTDGTFLVWNDFVVNEWCEQFSSTAVALMRLALLLNASERDAYFVNDELAFHKFAYEFMEQSAVADFPAAR